MLYKMQQNKSKEDIKRKVIKINVGINEIENVQYRGSTKENVDFLTNPTDQ